MAVTSLTNRGCLLATPGGPPGRSNGRQSFGTFLLCKVLCRYITLVRFRNADFGDTTVHSYAAIYPWRLCHAGPAPFSLHSHTPHLQVHAQRRVRMLLLPSHTFPVASNKLSGVRPTDHLATDVLEPGESVVPATYNFTAILTGQGHTTEAFLESLEKAGVAASLT